MASFTSGIKIQGVDIALSTQKYAKVSNYLDKQFGQFDEYYAIDLSEYGIHFNGRIPNEFRFIKKIDSTSTMKFEPYKPLATTSNPEGVLKYKGYALPLAYANDISKPKYDTTTNPSTRNSKDPGKWGNKRWQGSSVSKVWFKKNTSGDGIMTSTTSSSSGFSLMTYQNMMILELCAGGGAGGGAWGNIFGWNAGTGGGWISQYCMCPAIWLPAQPYLRKRYDPKNQRSRFPCQYCSNRL